MSLKDRLDIHPRREALRVYKQVRKRLVRPLEGTPGPPDFIGVGAMGSGGPWWHSLLVSHPQVRPPRDRRAAQRFFDDFCYKPMEESDVAEYYARFAKVPGTITGEWTEMYASQPWTLPLLKRVAPEARLLVSFVNPLDAYRKAYAQRRARVDRGDKRVWMNTAAADRTYGSQLRMLHRFFDPEQILVLQFERCRQDPLGEYRRTLRFLGLPDNHTPAQHRLDRTPRHERVYEALQKAHVPESTLDRTIGRPTAGHEVPELWPEIEEAIHVELDPEMQLLAELAPEIDLSLWPDFAHLVRESAPTPT
jgi:hypothetical protein